MTGYEQLDDLPKVVRRRTAERLQRLRALLSAQVPQRTLEDTLLLATWNIRELDSGKYGARCPECFFYIAEIIRRFDLVAVQEVREDLGALDALKRRHGTRREVATDDEVAVAVQAHRGDHSGDTTAER